jgi:hypothetical protein
VKHPRAIALRLLSTLVLTATAVQAASRNLAIIVDTSGSMQQNDRQRYTVQLTQVLADLMDTGDELSVIRMPATDLSFCTAGPSSSLVLQLDPRNRADFKRSLDGLIQFDTGTYFAASIRTAVSLLERDASPQRMLLVIADSGGLGICERTLTRELLALKQSGVTIAAINLGSSGGAFDANSAFDFTTSALDAQGLIEAVAMVYQRFLGAKQVQTGRVQGEIQVEIAPFVNEAFLVVAADGPIAGIQQLPGNPGAAAIDDNHRGGGTTRGLDGLVRGYRIARLERPAAGRWRFRAAGVSQQAGWMLLQDSAIGARMVSSPTIPKGTAAPIEVELIDQRTGKKVTDPSKLPGLRVELEADGRKTTFRDDGKNGDRQAGDGVYTAMTTFDKVGETPLSVHLQSDFLDRRVPIQAKVIDAAWRLEARSPRRVEVDREIALSVIAHPIGTPQRPPERIDALTGEVAVQLRDDGRGADRQAGDRTFTGNWTPHRTGRLNIDYVPVGGNPAAQTRGPLDILGRIRFGKVVPVRFGRIESESARTAPLDLASADVRGVFDLKVTSSFDRDRSIVEADFGSGWIPLGRDPQALRIAEGSVRTWPLRLRTGECPEGHTSGQSFEIVIAGTGADGRPVRTAVPVTVEIVPDSWLHCWWPLLVLGLAFLLLSILIHGYWSPSRFPPRIGVVLSPEEDLGEGFFHAIRSVRGSRSGFYRDARIYICQDYRLGAKPRNAVARLRADRKLVRIEPAGDALVWRRTADGLWEQIPPGESTARFGDVYRNDSSNLFFELRNA